MFRPSHPPLLVQNAEIDRMELPRIQDDAELEHLKTIEALVPIRTSDSLRFDPRLDPLRGASAVPGRVTLRRTLVRLLPPLSSADSGEFRRYVR